MTDLFAGVIDRDAALRTLQAFARGERTFVAAALVRMWCGHSRPTNRMVEPGDPYSCLLCGPQMVERIDLIEPTEFLVPDAFADLPEFVA